MFGRASQAGQLVDRLKDQSSDKSLRPIPFGLPGVTSTLRPKFTSPSPIASKPGNELREPASVVIFFATSLRRGLETQSELSIVDHTRFAPARCRSPGAISLKLTPVTKLVMPNIRSSSIPLTQRHAEWSSRFLLVASQPSVPGTRRLDLAGLLHQE